VEVAELKIRQIFNKIFLRSDYLELHSGDNFDCKELLFGYKQKYIIVNVIIIFGFLMTVTFGTTILKEGGNMPLVILEYTVAVLLLSSYLIRHYWHDTNSFLYNFVGRILPILLLCFLYGLMYFRGGNNGFVGIWILLTPLISIFTLGKRVGTIISIVMWLWILFVGFLVDQPERYFNYPLDITMRMFWLYFAIYVLAFSYELTVTINQKKIHQMVLELRKKNEELERLGLLDALTEINNRRGFAICADPAWRLAIREKKPISFAMIDIDHFKIFNDTHGHKAGDYALKELSKILKSSVCRPMDVIVRLGGEEFGILLFDTDKNGALLIAEKIRKAVEKNQLEIDQKTYQITVSIGIASHIPNPIWILEDLIDIADKKLYNAKGEGRNRVVG